MSIKFQNEYGSLELTPVTEYLPISAISVALIAEVEGVLFDLEEGEKIALITENKNIQMCFPYALDAKNEYNQCGYVIHHQSPKIGCICKVQLENFSIVDNLSPQEELTRLHKQQSNTYCVTTMLA